MKCQTSELQTLNFQSLGLAITGYRCRKHRVYTVRSASGKTGVLTIAKSVSDWWTERNQWTQLKRLAKRLAA